VAGDLAQALSPEAGYLTSFGAEAAGRNSNRVGDSPFGIPRVKDDYIFRLPGEGRRPLLEIFLAKLRRRTRQLDIY
jgi:hypothetical protein